MSLSVVDTPARQQGIVSSSQDQGWLGAQWMDAVQGIAGPQALARGRMTARRGRVQELWFTPGLATATVADSDEDHHVSVRVRTFETAEWSVVVDTLVEQLDRVAMIVEGDVSRSLVHTLSQRTIALLPPARDLELDCGCGAYLMPCVHAAAVCHLLADALDGDPFLLFTLRGYNREQLISQLRAKWGDTAPHTHTELSGPEAPPPGDWFRSPKPLPGARVQLHPATPPRPGVESLGPAPDQARLLHVLQPLYDAASSAIRARLLQEASESPARHHPTNHPTDNPNTKETCVSDNTQHQPSLTERIVNELASVECAKSRDLARRLDVPMASIRNELLELEEMGVVIRTGKTRGTRWWLG